MDEKNDVFTGGYSYELLPKYDGRKSFYKKAIVYVSYGTNNKRLVSYDTTVAEIKNDKLILYGWYSATTSRHINEFLRQNGYPAMSKKQIEQYIKFQNAPQSTQPQQPSDAFDMIFTN